MEPHKPYTFIKMLREIIQLLTLHEHYGVSEEIEIAKGKYQYPSTIKIGKRQLKRQLKWLKRK